MSPTNLSAGEFTIMDATQTACVRVPGGGAQESEYLYVALATDGTESQNGVSSPYLLKGGPSASASVAGLRSAVFDQAPAPAQAFHDFLRQRERALSERPQASAVARSRMSGGGRLRAAGAWVAAHLRGVRHHRLRPAS